MASQPGSLAQDVRACIDATAVADTVAGSRVVTLVVPHDLSWQPCKGPAEPPRHPNPIYQGPLQSAFLDDCAKAIAQSGPTCMLLLGGGALHGAALMAAGRIAATTGAVLVAENAFARADRGVGRPLLQVPSNAPLGADDAQTAHTRKHSACPTFRTLQLPRYTVPPRLWLLEPDCQCQCLATGAVSLQL